MMSAQDSEFSGCPFCSGAEVFVNVGPQHFFLCEEHGTAWCVGENLFSAWRDESDADRRASRERLQGFTIVRPRSGRVIEAPSIADVGHTLRRIAGGPNERV